MITAKSVREVGCNALKISPKQFLSTSAVLATRPRPRPAPKRLQTTSPQRLIFSVEEQLPPVGLLNIARKSEALDIEPDRALSILRKYIQMASQRKSGTWEMQFCKDETITPRTLILLALLLNKSRERSQQHLGMTLLFSASAIGEPFATMYLLNNALKGNALDRAHYAAPLAHLQSLASPPDSNIEAMILLGKIYNAQGKSAAALSLFKRATLTASPPPQPDAPVTSASPTHSESHASALVHFGTAIESLHNDTAAARAAFRTAALTHDDPNGYYHLGRLENDLSATQEAYFLKSAASGTVAAATALGERYWKLAEAAPQGSEAGKKHAKWAREWLFLSASAGEHESMLSLAGMLMRDGQEESAREWLDKAENASDMGIVEKARVMRSSLGRSVET